ncbi:SpvB/TcaC N-terminal domain-containing protein [Frankia sp. CiP3]|uniref:SpvB/TcaC N-terminal domain-containing protein n=1 Tax=Frankia sp. CiP3 TaxID=2880971 RepID=UPI001EF68DA4|nr:SpvB/TcaC N-terminal domain-containing protein [Frankia sp. CiP3]
MGDAAQAPEQIISLPQGGGALRGIGETFAPDLQTGTGNLTVPIAVPPGRRGLAPSLGLAYSTGTGNGYFGLGWALSVPGISRKTSRGVPVYDEDADTFVLSGSEDLAPVEELASIGTRYRPRTEGLFASIVRYRDVDSRQDYWEVTSKDGLVSRYGTRRPDSATSTWHDPALIADPSDPSHIFTWKLTETRDPLGNVIVYEYDADAGEFENHRWRQPLLRTIRYGDHTAPDGTLRFLASVTFGTEERPDPFSSYTAGFEIRTTRRYRTIATAVHADVDQAVRRYELSYKSDPYNGVSLLTGVAVIGFDDAGGEHRDLPPVSFGYGRFEPAKRRFQPVTGVDPPAVALSRGDHELVDLTGYGLPDVLQLDGVARYWRNLGGGRFDRPRPMAGAPAGLTLADPGVQLLDADGDGRADLLVTTPTVAGFFPLRFGPSWGAFHRHRNPPSFGLKDPEVRLIDLDGDGVTDVLRAGSRLECFFADPDTGWTGPRPARSASTDGPPPLTLTDPRVRWADMTGDGLTDLVLVHDGAVEYWPNLGHGRWGDRVRMTAGPRLPYRYDPTRLLLGDVDGDGLADLVHADDAGVTIWFNRSGNSWSDPVTVRGVPAAGWDIRITDLLGSGTGGILWSRDATASGRPSMYFLDLTGGVKPRLLAEVDNHIGAVTRVAYQPSTAYATADNAQPATRWRTPLPFVVPVVSRVESIDQISGGKLTTTYSYRHGYWDGAEREFRGFGCVEQTDTETFAEYHRTGLHPGTSFVPVGAMSFSPPTLTRTWFHLGPVDTDDEEQWAELDLSAEYWAGDPPLLDHTGRVNRFLRGLRDPAGRSGRRARRDALRALRGRVLRSEMYGLNSAAERDQPYTVTEHAYDLREEVTAGVPGRPRVFVAFEVVARTTQWERGTDPMTRFTFTGDHDPYGQPRRQTTVAPPRRSTRRRPFTVAPVRAGQSRTFLPDETRVLASHTRTAYSEPDQGVYIHDRVAQVRTYELVSPPTVTERSRDGDEVAAVLADQFRVAEAVRDTFDGLGAADVRLIGHVVHHYDGAAYVGRADGRVGPHGLLTRSEALVFRDGVGMDDTLIDAYGPWRPDYLGGVEPLPAGAPAAFGADLGYRHEPTGPADTIHVAGWYADTTRNAYDVQLSTPADPLPGRGLLLGAQDPLGHETRVTPDTYWLLPAVVRDPAKLPTTATYNYRAGRPSRVVDPNGNATNYRYHPLGLLSAVFLQGRGGEGGTEERPEIGYSYDLSAYALRGQPISVHTVARVWHASDRAAGTLPDDAADNVIETREYSDGFGRLVQKRAQADDLAFGITGNDVSGDDVGLLVPDGGGVLTPVPGRAGGPAVGSRVADRVVVSGWQVHDNKGRIVETCEPFFDSGWDYQPESEARQGKRVATFYDPRGQAIRVVSPDGSQRRTVFGVPDDLTAPGTVEPTPWTVTTYDGNDLAAVSSGPAGATLVGRAPASHHFTPATAFLDSLGRTVCQIVRGGPNPASDWHATQTAYDIRGNTLTVVDELGRTAFTHAYDLTNRPLRVDSIDAGRQITILDAAGNAVAARDARGCLTLRTYDVLNRPAAVFARDLPGDVLTMREQLTYGDGGGPDQPATDRAAARDHNRLGRLWQHLDEAGLVTVEDYDFTGKVTSQVRRVVSDAAIAAAEPDGWTANWASPGAAVAVLDPTEYRTTTRYDALGRAVRVTAPTAVAGEPDRVITPAYSRSGALRSVAVDGVPYVRLLAHNARGQRVLAAYGNGTSDGTGPGPVTRYAYDPNTFRLVRLRTERMAPDAGDTWAGAGGTALQDLTYTYDLVGNVTTIEERTTGCGVADTADGRDMLVRRFGYDPLYRLTSATGRACADIGTLRPLDDAPRCGSYPAAPNQANAPDVTAGYRESYTYDPAGNLLDLLYQVTTGPAPPSWHRVFGMGSLPPDEWADAPTNRLTSVRNGDQPEIALTYDVAGNLETETDSRRYTWDRAGRLVGFRTTAGTGTSVSARYLYGADGIRVKKWVRLNNSASLDESTVYLGDLVEHHRWTKQGGGRNSLLHVMDGTSRIALIRTGTDVHPDDAGPAIRYALADHLGSASLTLDATGAWTNREEYFPYGETSFGSFRRKRYRFTGKERDEESGLNYHTARYYAPYLTRWTSPDPAGQVDGSHLYKYSVNRPTNHSDPTGTQASPIQTVVLDEERRVCITPPADPNSASSSSVTSIAPSDPRIETEIPVAELAPRGRNVVWQPEGSGEGKPFMYVICPTCHGTGPQPGSWSRELNRREQKELALINAVGLTVISAGALGPLAGGGAIGGSGLSLSGNALTLNFVEVLSAATVKTVVASTGIAVAATMDWPELGGSGGGGRPPLKLLHPSSSLRQSSLAYWRNTETEKIIESFRPGSRLVDASEHLQIRGSDGMVFQGNTRLTVLIERGIDINALNLWDIAEIL